MSRYYTADSLDNYVYYQMPKMLFTNPKYQGLSLGAKAMYAVLKDRQELSKKNGWFDEHGRIFSVYTIDSREESDGRIIGLSELLGINRKTVMSYKKELVTCDLLVDRRMGRGNPNRIYVLQPEPMMSQSDKSEKDTSCHMKSKNDTSRSPKNTLQEVQKRDPIETDLNITEYSEKRDDDRATPESIITAVFQRFKDEITREDFEKVAERVIQHAPPNLEAYLAKSVATEIVQLKLKKDKPVKKTMSSATRKPKIDIIDDNRQEDQKLSAEEIEEMRALARKLDAGSSPPPFAVDDLPY